MDVSEKIENLSEEIRAEIEALNEDIFDACGMCTDDMAIRYPELAHAGMSTLRKIVTDPHLMRQHYKAFSDAIDDIYDSGRCEILSPETKKLTEETWSMFHNALEKYNLEVTIDNEIYDIDGSAEMDCDEQPRSM